jgi:hypothetical protein
MPSSDAAVDDHADPAVLHRGAAEIAAEQRTPARSATVDDQYASLSRALHRFLDA